MGFLQAVLGGIFTILGAGSMFFIAYRALTIGNDITEMKEILKDIRRGSRGAEAGAGFPAPLESYPPPTVAKLEKEFVMPPPISRRLDAERGIIRDSSDDLSLGFKSSERRH